MSLTLTRSIYEFYAQGSTYDELHEANKRVRSLWERYIPDTSFKFTVMGYNHRLSQRRQREVIENFSYMDFLGKIEMKNPEITLGVFEECTCRAALQKDDSAVTDIPAHWLQMRMIADLTEAETY